VVAHGPVEGMAVLVQGGAGAVGNPAVQVARIGGAHKRVEAGGVGHVVVRPGRARGVGCPPFGPGAQICRRRSSMSRKVSTSPSGAP
jgi:hypothetical protein